MSDIIRMLFMRHGESDGNLSQEVYATIGDFRNPLTDEGWKQVIRAGEFLADDYYPSHNITEWPHIQLSEYVRTQQTCAGALHSLKRIFPGDPALHLDFLVIEKFFGSPLEQYRGHEKVDTDTLETLIYLSKATHAKDPLTSRPLFGESTKDVRHAVRSQAGTMARDMGEGKINFLSFTHGATIQAKVSNHAHVRITDKNKIGNPGNADIIEIAGTPKNWTIAKIFDGARGVKIHQNLLEGIERFTVKDLPLIPAHIQAGLNL